MSSLSREMGGRERERGWGVGQRGNGKGESMRRKRRSDEVKGKGERVREVLRERCWERVTEKGRNRGGERRVVDGWVEGDKERDSYLVSHCILMSCQTHKVRQRERENPEVIIDYIYKCVFVFGHPSSAVQKRNRSHTNLQSLMHEKVCKQGHGNICSQHEHMRP